MFVGWSGKLSCQTNVYSRNLKAGNLHSEVLVPSCPAQVSNVLALSMAEDHPLAGLCATDPEELSCHLAFGEFFGRLFGRRPKLEPAQYRSGENLPFSS